MGVSKNNKKMWILRILYKEIIVKLHKEIYQLVKINKDDIRESEYNKRKVTE
jgi:hypothetical protein